MLVDDSQSEVDFIRLLEVYDVISVEGLISRSTYWDPF